MRALCIALGLVCALSTQVAQAANQFTFNWRTYNHPNSCRTPGLVQQGLTLFNVNMMPIPTYSVPNSVQWGALGSFLEDYQAPFSGALFRVGSNDIEFSYSVAGLPPCVWVDDTVYLSGPSVNRLIFQTSLYGPVPIFHGATDVNLSLREIDPVLADSLADLKKAIEAMRAQLRALGQEADTVSAHLDALEAQLDELLDRGFDEIDPAELDALLAQFDGLPEGVRDALVQFLSDLQGDIQELRDEIQRIAEVFADRVNNVDGVGDGAPGFDPTSPGGFDPIETGDVPPISIPEVLGDDPWTPGHDPYDAYADQVLATLGPTVSNGKVEDRATFLNVHGAWVHNIRALASVLQRRATVTVAEWGAFLGAKERVLSFVERFIDPDGWMKDAPIPPEVRELFLLLKDIDVVYRFRERAKAMQLELNMWTGALTPRQRAILDALLLFDAILRERLAQQAPAEPEDGFWSTMGNVFDTVISFTPVGDFLDLCAAITGREGCISGRELTLEERALHGLGVLVGSGAAWKAAASTVSGGAVAAVRKVGDVLDEVPMRAPQANIVEVISHPGNAKTYVHANGFRVRYDRRGFPDFSPHKYTGTAGKAEVRITYTGGRTADYREANRVAGFTDGTPIGYTWHHHHDVGKMLLVRTDVHHNFAHTGGVALYQKMYNMTYGS